MIKTKLSLLLAVSTGLLLTLAGCGGPEKGVTKSSGEASTAAPRTAAPATGRAIAITGNDTMKFDVTEMRAKPGEALSVTLTNVGTMPKFSMGHNWILLAAGTNVDDFVLAASQAPTTDYVPPAFAKNIIAYSKLLGPKESDTLTFHAPSKPGTYTYLCSFPGHYQVGMKGVLIVE